MRINACFLGGTRYSQPLDPTSQKKFDKLAKLGQIVVIGFSMDAKPRRFEQYAHFYLLPYLSVPILRYLLVFGLSPIVAILCIFRHDVRILVAQSPYEGFAAACAKILVRIFGKRVALIVESHGDFEVSLFLQRRILLPAFYRFFMCQTVRFTLRHADVLRCVSDSSREQLEAWAPAKAILKFPTWTDIDLFLAASGRNERNGDEKTILYVGVLVPRKGVHFLLSAFAQVSAQMPSAKLWVIGKAEDVEYANGLRKQAERLGVDGRVSFMGTMPQRKLAEHMVEADVFILPTQSEGLPRVVFEAMAAGMPVIASAVSGIPEIIEDGKTGFLVPSGDVTALVNRLRLILQDPQQAREMGRNAREYARNFFSSETYVQNYARLFELASQAVKTHAE